MDVTRPPSPRAFVDAGDPRAAIQPWIADEQDTGPADPDTIVVQPRSLRTTTVALGVLLAVAALVVGVLRSSGHHAPVSAVTPRTPFHPARTAAPSETDRLYQVAAELCTTGACQIRAIHPSVLRSLQHTFALDQTAARGYTVSDVHGPVGFIARLSSDEHIIVLCRGRKTGRMIHNAVPADIDPQAGAAVATANRSYYRDGWALTVTLLSGSAAEPRRRAAATWLRTGVLP